MFNKVTSVEQAFEITGITPDLEKFKALGLPEDRVQPLFDGYVIELVCEATNKINDDRVADWADDDQYKYSPAHWVEADDTKPAGFGLADTLYGNWISDAYVGERLLVGSSEQAIYIAEQFKPLFESARLIVRKK